MHVSLLHCYGREIWWYERQGRERIRRAISVPFRHLLRQLHRRCQLRVLVSSLPYTEQPHTY
jgi:hypothetical protein